MAEVGEKKKNGWLVPVLVILVLIIGGVLVALNQVGSNVNNAFEQINTDLDHPPPPAPAAAPAPAETAPAPSPAN